MKDLKIKRMVIVFSVVAAGLIYALFFIKTGVGIPCLFRLRTGYLCPSCGTTRMIADLFSADLHSAFSHNPLMLVLLPVFLYFAVSIGVRYIRTGTVKTKKYENLIFIFIIIIMIIFAVVRNLI